MKAQKLTYSQVETVRLALMKQGSNLCALCYGKFGTPALSGNRRRPALDHNHKTGYVRDVLCLHCNGMLGKVENASQRAVGKDEPLLWWLTNVVEYLTKHATPQYQIAGVRTGLIYPTHKTPEDKRLARLEKAKKKRAQAKIMKKVG